MKKYEKLMKAVKGFKEYFDKTKGKREEWNAKVEGLAEKIDEVISPRVLVFPVQFENILEIGVDDVKVREFEDIDEFEKWLTDKGKNGKYLLVHNLYREFLLYIKEGRVIWVINLEKVEPPERILISEKTIKREQSQAES